MTYSSHLLVPSLDRRLAAWLDIDQRRRSETVARLRPTITISRQFGCEGFPLAECLEEMLRQRTKEDWNIFDKSLLERVAHDEHLSMRLLENLGDETWTHNRFAFLFPQHTTHCVAYSRIPKYILAVAHGGNAVIVGRGGAVITRHLKNCFHFRLEAPFDFRVQSIARRMSLAAIDAEAMVKTNERQRERFLSECLRCDISDTTHYDAVFNNARQPVRRIARVIVDMVSEAWAEQEESKKRKGTEVQIPITAGTGATRLDPDRTIGQRFT